MPPQPIISSGTGARIASAATRNGSGQNRAVNHLQGAAGFSTLVSAFNPKASVSPNAWACKPARPSLRIQGTIAADILAL